ncbi:MAG: hypothetical protein E4H19_04115 [Chromatiales bacterium]|jgi:opacity protein-like surface antigen|nr:MAG: hypothetical protein E4H19_04115 [Chromatiales bacterium]
MSKSFTLLMAMVAATPSVALAGPYFGIGAGGARMESSLAELGLVPGLTTDTDVIGTDPDFSSTDVSFDVTAGWMFGEYIGVEVGYTDFGRATQNYELPLSPPSCLDNDPTNDGFGCQEREWTAQVDMTALRAFIVGNLPLNENFDVYAKVGAVRWDADYSGFERNQILVPGLPVGPRNDPVNFDDDGTDLAAGIGLTMKTDTPFSLRVDFSYYDVHSTDLLWTAELSGIYTFDW